MRYLFAILSTFVATLFCSGNKDNALGANDLPIYKPVSDLPSGELCFVGSESVNALILDWLQKFQSFYPQVTVSLQAKNSDAAVDLFFANPDKILLAIPRGLTPEEEGSFKAKYGYEPTPIRVAVDAIGIYVHETNPLMSISLDDLKRVYSHNDGSQLLDWSAFGLQGSWASLKVKPWARNPGSGTRTLFDQVVLGTLSESPTLNIYQNPWDLFAGIRSDHQIIGYTGIVSQKFQDVKILPIKISSKEAIAPSHSACLSGGYPLSRPLFVYIGSSSKQRTSTVCLEFFRYILSQNGQIEVPRHGMFPLTSSTAANMMRRVQGQGIIGG